MSKAKHWKPNHVQELCNALDARHCTLLVALKIHTTNPDSVCIKNPTALRLAVDDYKTILAELKRLI